MVNSESSAVAQGRGRWSEAGVPHKGWHCIDVDDIGAPDEICGMCQSREIRFVHIMEHPAFPETLRVGCICSGHMSGDVAGAERREKSLHSRASKRKRWLGRHWKVSAKGNEHIKSDGFHVTIFHDNPQSWRFVVSYAAFKRFGRLPSPTSNQCKLSAFDAISWLLAHRDKWDPATGYLSESP